MKRKIALALAAVMTVAMLPMNAMAASSNSLSQSNTSISNDEILIRGVDNRSIDLVTSAGALADGTPVSLQVRPTSEVKEGESIFLTVENGKFDERLIDVDPFQFKTSTSGMTYNDLLDRIGKDGDSNAVAQKYIKNESSRRMPYGFRYINSEQIEVYLWPISDTDANQNTNNVASGSPYYDIALPITTEDSDEGAVTVSIDSNDSAISSGTYTVATVTDSDGSTTATVVAADVDVTSDETFEVPDITIKEDLAGTFAGQTIKVKLNGNFEWASRRKDKEGNYTSIVKGGVNLGNNHTAAEVAAAIDPTISINGRTLEFTLPSKDSGYFDNTKTSSIIITGFYATSKQDDTYGDVNVTISGDSGITSQTLKIGERQDYGFALTALEEPTTIFAGRSPFADDMDEDDFVTAEFEFGETTPGTWLTGRKLEFTVPEGVKIVGYDITKTKYMSTFPTGKIVDDGQTLRFDSISSQGLESGFDDKNASYFDMKLYLSTSIDFSGDVTLGVSGAGLDADTLSDLVIAKVVTPVTVEAATTKSNIGYKSVETADIKITENTYGALQDGKEVAILLDDTYDTDLAFDDANTKISVDGELEVKNFKVRKYRSGSGAVNRNAITFTIDSESYSAPSTITISGVAVGTTRSIPYGSYSIIVGGDAVVNNYKEDVDQKSTIEVSEGDISKITNNDGDTKDFDLFEDEGFEFDNYLEIITETTTLDGEVRVTIGEKSLVMDGETVEMDAAAYIQTSSNSTMVPLRFVTLALGVDQDAVTDADNSSKIAWDATSKTATIMYSAGSQQKIIQFTAGSPNMIVDGVTITMENGVVSEIVDGRMYVPFRALGQALGVPVTWDAETRTAIYNEK